MTDKETILELRGIIAAQSQQRAIQSQQIRVLEDKTIYLLEQIQKLSVKKDSF